MLPRSGDVLRVTRAASVQFADPMLFRVIRVHDWPTYDGWSWLDGYQLDRSGDAVERRSIFVLVEGLQHVVPMRPNRTNTRPATPTRARNNSGPTSPPARRGRGAHPSAKETAQ